MVNKVFYILFLFLFFFPELHPQWQWQNPLPQGNDLEQVFFVDNEFGWILSTAGTVMRTTNGGSDWNEEILGKLWSQKIYFIDRFIGWCVGSGAPPFVMQTTDGGRNWFDLPIPEERNDGSYYNLWDVFFVDTLKGYFVDDEGAIFNTVDGGQSWNKQFQNFLWRELKNICFPDSLKGFAVGYDVLKRTDDGGDLWYADSSVVLPFDADPRKIQFIDNLYGWIMSTKSVFRTTNGGDTWIEYTISSGWNQNDNTLDLMFINPQNGWLSSTAGLYYSADSGKIWTNINSNNLFRGLNFFNLNEGFGTADYKIYYSDNGGFAWITEYTSITNETLYGLDFVNENRGWAVGREGEIIHTSDGGTDWQNQISNTTEDLRDVKFWDENTGWIVGRGGVILRTTDGGDIWEKNVVNVDYSLEAISYITCLKGWTAGYHWIDDTGIILHTTDGGINWIDLSPTNAGRFFGICFVDSLKGWAVSGGGTVFDRGEVHRTTDGGTTWTLQLYDPYNAFSKIVFVNTKYGWIASDNFLLKTSDGGETWMHEPPALEFTFDIHFIDTLRGWATGLQGDFSYTTNGGESWIPKRLQTAFTLSEIDFVDENHGWAVGDLGRILHTTNGGVSFQNPDLVNMHPENFNLFQNYPNPFNSTTKIKFTVPTSLLNPSPYQGEGDRERFITLKVYDVLGKEIATLINEAKHPGDYEVEFNADQFKLSSSVYIYGLTIDKRLHAKKMIFLK